MKENKITTKYVSYRCFSNLPGIYEKMNRSTDKEITIKIINRVNEEWDKKK